MADLSHLQIIFLLLIATELMLFFVMDGADFGAGMATFFVGDDDAARNQIMKVTGPVWGGNETWAVTAFAIMFAAYPGWYTAVTGYYIPVFLILLFLMFRGVAFDYRNQWHSRHYNRFWDWALMIGSLIPPFLFGLIFSSMISGVTIRNGYVHASVGDLLTFFNLAGGVLAVVLSLTIGLARIIKKVPETLAAALTKRLKGTLIVLYVVMATFAVSLPLSTTIWQRHPVIVTSLLVLFVLSAGLEWWTVSRQYRHTTFWLSAIAMASFVYTIFLGNYPNLVIGKHAGTTITAKMATSGPVSLVWTAWLVGFMIITMVIMQSLAYHWVNEYYHDPNLSPLI
ncbi:cytochrome d ubiquinol oxidase subunit II [Schleiferilactobacillus perolens]|jgi:cytochrome bd-type quinol oxidase subunit 2|uniref:cytochrome d ubiquinol oxidase subunit II n=1 Tax=Schleiferilactobacillus perolens TaxID=100468 RepID=UPI00235443E8|nr:cytochrome d ubiquinol oxidase subunit II [Schleiferilactobacillus perolens]MCI2172191.1 cytochrome d ubiquinol oxidase subunit II [Schleiferilactobacillus perolens]